MDDKKPNPFDQFDPKPAADGANPFDKFDDPNYRPPGAGSRLKDLALSLASGVVGVPETAVGLADLVTGGQAGKKVQQAGVDFHAMHDALHRMYSPAQQEANAAVEQAKGFVPTIAAMVQNPSTIVQQAVESAPTMLSGGLLGRGLLKAVPEVGAIGAGAFGEGATAAGQNTEQVRQEDPNGLLTPQQAGILAASGALTGAIGLGAGQLANKLGIGDAATMLAAGHLGPVGEQAAAVAAKKGVLRKIGEGALVEGIGQELPQSYQEQVAQNVAQGKPWDEGAAAAGAQGMLAGGLMGAVSGPLHSGHEEHAAAPAADSPVLAGDQPLAPPAAPAGPLTRAAAQVEPQVLFPFRSAELAQKQADLMTTERGVPYEVIDHPSAAGKFAAVPAKPKEASDAQDDVGAAVRAADLGAAGPDGGAGLDQPAGAGAVGGAADGTGAAAGAGAQDAAGQAAARQRDAAPVGLQPGEPVQVTLGGVDQFEGGTRVRALSDDGQYATVEGSDAAVPLASLTRIDPAAAARLDEGAHQAATSPANARPEPTEGQKQAGNYKKGPATLQGLDLSIKNPAGSTRSGVDRDGTPWQTTMQNHYGYIRGTEGADNEHIDAYVGPNPASHRVFVVDQVDPRTGQFDEHKVMLGFNSQEQARAAYDAHYAPDWQGGAHMTATTIDGFKQWMQGDTTEPFNPALLEQAAAPGRQQDQAPDTSTPKGEAPLSDQQLSDLFDQAERETAAEQQQGQNPADEAKVMAEKLRAEHDAKDQADLKAEAEALYGDIDRQIQQAAAAGDVQQLMALTEQRARLLGLHPPAVDEAQQDRAPGGSQAAPPAPEQADSAAAHLQAISDQVARTGTAYVGDVFAPGHKRTGIDQDDNAAAQVHDDAYRTALRDAGWQLVPKTPAQVKAKVGGETWTKDGQRLLMNHPIVGKPASLLLQPAPGADPQAELAAAKANPDGATLSPAAQALNEQEGAARFAGAHPQLAPQDTPAAPAASNSAQFDAYKKAIEAGQTSPGMLEQIHADERLNDGEADQLTALAKAKAPQANVPEPQPTGKTSSGEDAFTPTPEQYRAAGQQVAAAPFFRTRGAYYQVDRMRADGTVEGRLMNMATLKPRGAGPDMHRFILQNGQLGQAHRNPGHEGGSVTFHPDVELLDKLPVDAPHPDNAKKFAELDPRVLKALEPGQYGGRLTAERLGGILGDADKPGTTIGTERAQKALDRLVFAGKVVKDGQSYQLADKTRQDKPGAVDYPNRSLGFQKAATSEQDAYNDHAWANIAAANMQKGDTFKLNGKQQSVESITDKTLKLKDADGKVRTLNPDGAAWGQFVRDLGGQLGAENLQANNILKPKRPLLEILKRDPAVHVDANGSVYLRDGGPVGAAPAKAAPEQQAAVPEAIAKLFRTGSSTGLSAFEEKQVRALMAWGYDASNVRFNMFGRPADTIGPMEIALSAGSENKIRLMVTVAHAPNGKWGVGISIRAPHTAATEAPSVFSPQFDTRLAAIEYGMQRWREVGLADLKKQREDQGGYIDSAFAKMETELAALHGSAAPQPAPAGQGKEVSRFAGKFGKGMTEANAKMAAANRAKADPAHEYSVEEAPRHGPGKYEVVGREKVSAPVQQAKQEAKPEAMAAEPAEDLADHAKWNQDREDRIAASRKNGNTHLDKLEKTVEAMRGKPFYNVHDRKEQGVVRSVDMHGNVVVTWKDSYSAGKNLVDKQTQDGKKQVWQSMLSPSDLKDYVVGLPKVEQAETPWKDSPFAARVDAVLAKLQAVDPDSVKFFRSGFETDARHNQLTEERVAFRENKANQIVGEKTGKVTPVPFTPIDAAGLQELTGVAKALPKEIVDAAIARWNPIAEQLAALGYRHGEVDKSKPQAAQELDAQLREIAQVLMGLAPRRYMAAKNQKGADPAKLAREEDDATRVLGLDTRQYPGIDTSRQITLGQGVKDKALPPVAAAPQDQAEQARQQRAAQRAAYNAAARLPSLLEAASLPAAQFREKAERAVNDWVATELALAGSDGARRQMLDGLVADGKSTLPAEFYTSLHKYLQRAKRSAEQQAARDPEIYKQALLEASVQAGLPVDAPQVALFKDGWDHALAGRTKSTLRSGELPAKGYAAAMAWRATDAGAAWYTGKRGAKLENTGAELRRWFDERTRKIKEVSAADLPASYAIIKDQAARAGAFANLAGEGATPGTLRYIEAVRDALLPFQEWLVNHGPLRHLYGETGYRTTDAGKVERYLDGRTYVVHQQGEQRISGESDSAEDRLALLQSAAADYMERLQPLVAALQGATTVAEAAARYTKMLYTETPEVSYRHRERLTEAGKRVDALFRRYSSQFVSDNYTVRELTKHENEPDAPGTKKQALLVPKLDRVVREGGQMNDWRGGKNVTPAQAKRDLGLADVGFGKWVGTRDDQDHLNYAYDALMDLAHLLGIEPKQIGLGGTLHLTIGALGHGRHAAHFQPEQAHPDGGTVPVINVTNTRGDGTVAHEWMHALDHALSVGGGYGKQTVVKGELVGRTWVQHPAVQRLVKLLTTTYDVDRIVERLRPFLTGDSFMIRRGRSKPTHDIKTEAGLVENASHAIDYLARQSRQTNYKAQADAMGRDYWGNERELVARAAEAYVLDTLDGTNNYLVNPAWVGEGKIKAPAYKGAPYPMGDERRLFNEAMGALLKSLRFENGKVTIDAATFNEQFPDVARQFKEALESIRAALPGMVHQALAEKEARRLAAKHAKDAAESAKQQQAQAEQAARDAAEQARMKAELEQAEQAPAQPPAGPLSDAELENLFDEAENQLAEQQQEQPEAAAPGEATQAGRWTQDDIRHLLEQVEDGKVILLADPALGLATIHDLPGAVHLGYGTFRVSTPAYEATFEGGGAMRQTPGGQAYTTVHISRGRDELLKAIHWDQAKARLQARLIAKTGPKALPPLSAEQEKTAGQLIAEAAKLGVTGIDEALKGLTKLFGAGGGKLQSFPGGLDEDAYRQAKPHFEAALKAFQAAGKTLVDLFKMLIQNFGAGVRPYAIQFAKEQGLSANLAAPASATERVARFVETALAAGDTITSKALFEAADGAFGGTQAEGKYIAKDAYDAMEAGVNRYVMAQRITPDGSATDAAHKIAALEAMQQRLPTQTRRSAEMDEYQQFSTPPTLAFAAAWAANIKPGETVLEPSAGIGSLAMYAELAGADLVLNELSARRHAVLHEVLPEARLFKENAEQLDNVLPADINPGTVLMNPPFSSSAGRMAGVRDTHNGAVHVEQALKRLAPGGRLVAIVGNGMAADKPAFRAWWNKIKQDYNVRANVGVDGKNYAKYGTTFDNQLLVIDKTGPTAGPVVTGQVATVGELPALLEGIRNDRQSLAGAGQAGQPAAAEPDRGALPGGRPAAGNGAGGADLDALGAGKRDQGAATGAGRPERGEHDGANHRDDALGAAQRGALPDQPGKPGGRGAAPGGTGRAAGRAGSGGPAAGEPVQRDGGERPVSSGLAVEATDVAKAEGALTDAIFESYAPQRLAIPGAKAHPGKLVQSAAMAAVEPPKPTYTPNLPKAVIDKGLLSLPQLEAVVYAGQAHREMLPGDQLRRGYFIGDGTGVGKGREIAGILLDNWRGGRKKAVWLSAKQGLLRDARRDFAGVSGEPALLLAHNKYKAEAAIDAKQGILFTTYDTLRSGAAQKKGDKPGAAAKSRLDQIVDWLGKDFDGVIAFDEAHHMGNALPKKGKRGMTKPAAKALAGIELQNRLPNARIVYVSATGATEVSNLAYATRLGLWGEGSAFATPAAFVGGIEAGGVAAMELVSRDMKAAGSYLARSLSYDGVTYDRLEHVLTPLQNDIYNALAGAWQTVLQNVNAALEETQQAKDPKAKSSAMAQFWGSHQRFFNHVITAMQMPSILESAQADLAAGHAVVMQLVNTNEAEQERQAAKIAGDDEAVLEDLDFTPRETLLNYVRNSFPVAQFEEYTDDNGNKQVRPVLDAAGKAVQNREMVARREQLVKTLEAIRVPDNPIDMIINTFGPDHVAEITGRKRRFVQVPDKKQGYKVVEQKRPASAVTADADAFMDDKKRVLVFSDAGGTGYSFQSDLGVKNQRRRMHYLVQPGWRADNAVQGFGRTHRSNEANQPHYVLPTTNLKAQKRFISSIARRLDQLGALTKGQRETGSQGMFSATDNLESQYASDALHNLFMDMYNQVSPLPFGPTTDALGLTNLVDQNGALSTSKLPNVPQFLNRLLSLTTTMQDTVFDEFFKGLEETIARAKANGTFDAGMETLHADKVEKLRDEVVHTDARTGAQTRYIELELTHPTEFNSFDGALATQQTYGERGLGFYRSERTGRVFSLVRTGTTTDARGNVVSRGRREMTTGMARYGDDVDTVLRGASGGATVKKTITVQRYQQPAAGALSESYQDANGNTKTLTDTAFGRVVDRVGLERARAGLLTAPAGAQRDAGLRLLDKMAPHLTDVEAEREIPAFTRLPEAQARAAWEAEQAATPQTYTSKTHLLAGMLLPIWDRLPGDPRVVRTQTADGERLLGRVVATRDLAATLRNLGVGSNLGKIAPDKVLERILAGERAVLANGWVLQRARVGNEWRVEVSGGQLAYSQSERRLLEQQGAFSERINWQERLFIPTGANGPVVLARVISNKPLVDLGNPDAAGNDADEAAFSRGLAGPGMAQAELQQLADALRASWVNGPPVAAVQSLAELPFKAPADTRGVYYQGRVWLVADNLHNEGEAQLVLAHEAFGHAGLAALMDPVQLAKELNRLRLINPALAAAARAQAAKYGYELPLATEEALADMAASGKPVKGWQQFVAKVQALLRSIGLGRVADWIEAHTAAETMDLLRRAREAIEGKRTPVPFGSAEAARYSDGAATRWYSALARQVERLPMKAAPALQWAETIMGSGFAQKGVKQEEIEWSGVLNWLAMQQQQGATKVSKAALLDYLAGNGVRVEETMLGEPLAPSADGIAQRAAVFAKYQPQIDQLRARSEDFTLPSRERDEAEQEWEELMSQRDREADAAYRLPADDAEAAQYASYTLPGGRNYRELLLTLPGVAGPSHTGTFAFPGEQQAEDFLVAADAAGLGQLDYGRTDQDDRVEFKRLSAHDYATLLELARSHGGRVTAMLVDTKGNNYQSPHWQHTRNVLAHVRFNERTDSEGNKVLFVEELQSDWANQGRRMGFGPQQVPAPTAMRVEQIADPYVDRHGRRFEWVVREHNALVSGAFASRADAEAERTRLRGTVTRPGAPRAPFVEKTDGWLALALKRVISFAAQNGFDKVAFINGRQAVERFKLSDRVDKIDYYPAHDGATMVAIYPVGADPINLMVRDGVIDPAHGTPHQFVGQRLEQVIGKDLAERILADPQAGAIEGNGMQVGGDGMRAFYDTIVPNAVNDVLKRLGGGRIGIVDMHAPDQIVDGQAVYGQAQRDALQSLQPGFAIGDALREQAQSGLPLFERRDLRLRAPNGQPSNLNPALWQQVRSPAFKAWFGDWENNPAKASQVVDENGEPRVVYHGTHADVGAFDKGKIRHPGGFWFAERNDYTGNITSDGRAGFNQMPVFLNIRRPIDGSRYAMARQGTGPFDNTAVQRNIKLFGSDGVRIDNGSDSVWVALEPTQVKSALGNSGQFDPANADLRFSRATPEGESRSRAAPGANVQRLAALLGPQLYGDMGDMGPVTVKELFQNAFDALKGQLESGRLAHGSIEINTDHDTRTITVADNGAGMTPEIINKAFLTIAGTNKETTRSSGGFGIAKMLFLFGNKSLSLVTVRDGVEARLDTTGEQLMASFSDPAAAPEIVTRPTDAPNGTTVTVTLPAEYLDPSTGRTQPIMFPDRYSLNKALDKSPLFENITVRLNGSALAIGQAFPKDAFTTFSTVKFDWGTARIIVSKQEKPEQWGGNLHVLSNGLWQFGGTIKENPFSYDSQTVPREFYINVEPRLKPEEAGYPFALNRKGFSPAVAEDFAKIYNYLSVLYGANKTAEHAAGFGAVQYVNPDGSLSAPLQLAPKLDQEAKRDLLHINEGDRIEIHDGRMTVNGRAVPELSREQLDAVKIDMSKFKIGQDQVDPGRPMIHDNVDVKWDQQAEAALAAAEAELERLQAARDAAQSADDQANAAWDGTAPHTPEYEHARREAQRTGQAYRDAADAWRAARDAIRAQRDAYHNALVEAPARPVTEVMRARFGARFDRFLGEIGRQFMRLRDAAIGADEYKYGKLAAVPVGVSFDQEYYGVHTMVPFRAMFLNPAITAVDDPGALGPRASNKLIATAMVGTMIHEIAHFAQMNHSTGFISEMQRITALLDSADNFNLANLKQEVRSILDRNHDIYSALNRVFRGDSVSNRGVKLADGSAYSARNAGPADAVGGAGGAGEDDGRVAGRAGTGAGLAAAGDERDGPGAAPAAAGDVEAASRRAFDDTVARLEQDGPALPKFARASPGEVARQAGAAIRNLTVTDVQQGAARSVRNKMADLRSIGLQFLGRQQIKDVYGELFPQGKQPNLLAAYDTLAMRMDAEKNEAGTEADAIASRWAKLPDEGALAELMHDATRYEIDPARPYLYTDDRREYEGLRTRWDALSSEAKALYIEARDAYARHYDQVKAAIRARIARTLPGHPSRAALLAAMEGEFFHKIRGVYFPLARFGDYMVQVRWVGRDPKPGQSSVREAVSFAETMGQAEALRADLMRKYPAAQGYQVLPVTKRAEYNAARDSVSRGFLKKLFGALDEAGLEDPSLQDTINQLYLNSLPDLSWAKHGIARKGTPGFSQDARRAFAHHMFHGASYLAKLNYSDQLAEVLESMQGYANAHANDPGYDQVKAQHVLDEMYKRHDLLLNPTTSRLSQLLTSVGFAFYLGLSPASALVNLSQTAMVAYPVLAGRFGFAKAGAALLQASKDAVRGHNDMSRVLAGDERRAFQEWVRAGVVDVTMAHDLAQIAAGMDGKLFGTARTALKAASFMFHHAERFNRQATALAAYRLARAQGMEHEAAYRASVDATYAAHFNYSAGNRPRIMQGNVAKVVLLFKQYGQNMIYTLARNAQLAFKGDRQAAKTFAGLLTTHALAAGVLGLPLVTTLLAAASMLGGSDDEPWDAEVALRNLFADTFGTEAGAALAHGLSRLTPWDVSARVGLNSMLLPDVQEGLEGTELAEAWMAGLLGPVAGIVVNAAKGMHEIAHGRLGPGLETMLPAVLRGPLKAMRYHSEGIRDRTGVTVLPETTAAEEAGQALGFSPSRGREAQEVKSAIYQRDRDLQQRRGALMASYAQHAVKHEDTSADLAAISAFNALHPNRVIAPLHLRRSVMLHMKHIDLARQGIYLPPKRGLDARQAALFGQSPDD